MTDASALGTIDEDVEFAWGEASALRQEMLRAATELEHQAKARSTLAADAKEDWHGRYVSVFERQHMRCTVDDGFAIASELRNCAKMLHQLAQLAREENKRRALARAWKDDHEHWERTHDGGPLGLGDLLTGDDEPKMPDLPEIIPHPLVASSPPVGSRE
jgi:hypothetical protein